MAYRQHTIKGFSLLELLLALAIMATIMVSIIGYTTRKSDEMRRDRAVMQVQQVLNAGLSYYISFGAWPSNLSGLQTQNFLPSGTITNPWGQNFSVGDNLGDTHGTLFSVCTTITGQQAYTAATTIAGRLPIATAIDDAVSCPTTSTTACKKSSTRCTVVSSVNIPGQNLNNARAINFAGLYHNGACVAAPSCPSNMVPSIFVTPVSVSGMNDNNTTVYPISSFSAYAMGIDTIKALPGTEPLDCNGLNPTICQLSSSTYSSDTPSTNYWRVCIRIMTQKGLVTKSSNASWAQDAGIILALTRCMPASEQTIPQVSGSDFTVFQSD